MNKEMMGMLNPLYELNNSIDWVLETGKKPILIYQMGKVASSSIYASLKKSLGHQVFHVHRLYPENIKNIYNNFTMKGRTPPECDKRGLILHSRFIKEKHPVKVITLVREPIGRNISAYFENLDSIWNENSAHLKQSVNALCQGFISKYNHEVPLNWFDNEFRMVTGLDVFSTSFPYTKKFLMLSKGMNDILVMRSDLADNEKNRILREFTGVDVIDFIKKNDGSQKTYSKEYAEFKRIIRLPQSYVMTMLNSKYARHFFSQKERDDLKGYWLKKKSLTSNR